MESERSTRSSTTQRYFARIERVVDALLAAPAQAHSVASLAAIANMSSYHFHRVFRAVVGETVHATMRRVRLSLAADRLASGAEPVRRIAETAGYQSPQAFARAFRSFANASPDEFRRRHRQSADAARQRLAVGGMFDGTVDVIEEPGCCVFALRHSGPIATIPASARQFWQWQLRRALITHVRQVIGVVYPDADEPRGFRYYTTALIDDGHRDFDDMTKLSLPGGLYARYRLHGPCSLIAPTFYALQRDWLRRSDFELDARPLLERYVDHAWSHGESHGPVTYLQIPIRRQTTR